MDSEEELPDIPYTPVTTEGRNVTSGRTDASGRTVPDGRSVSDGRAVTDGRRNTDPSPSTERQGAKRSVPLSAEEKRRLAAERKLKSHAAKSATEKEMEHIQTQDRIERLR